MSVPSLQTSNDVILKPASSGKKLDHLVTSENPPETRSPKQKKTNIQSQSHWPAMKLNSSFRWKEHFFLVLPSLMSSECPFFLYKFWNISTVRVRIYWGSLHVLLKWYSVTDHTMSWQGSWNLVWAQNKRRHHDLCYGPMIKEYCCAKAAGHFILAARITHWRWQANVDHPQEYEVLSGEHVLWILSIE